MFMKFIIPCYNIQHKLGRMLDSILGQTFTDYHIVCVDDCSTDGTYAFLQDYSKRHPSKFTIVKNLQNIGPGQTRNIGFEITKDIKPSDFVWMVDGDDRISNSDVLKTIFRYHVMNPEKEVIILDYESGGMKKSSSWRFPYAMWATVFKSNRFVPFSKKNIQNGEDIMPHFSIIDRVDDWKIGHLNRVCYDYTYVRNKKRIKTQVNDIKEIKNDIKNYTFKKKLIRDYVTNKVVPMPYIKNENSEMMLVIFDSQNKAGDNGEYLYRRVRDLYPEINLTFLINEQSKDYTRLKNDGFNVKSFSESNILFPKATFILFSKDLGGNNPAQQLLAKYREKTVFLGHGVTSVLSKDSSYIKGSIGKIAKFMCCTSDEEAGVIKRYSDGKLFPLSCGFPRHDFLLQKFRNKKNENVPKCVFISFHYRMRPDERYFSDINRFLNSSELQKLHESGVKINFLPHARLVDQIGKFKVPDYINVPLDTQFQDILVESDLLITDISSNNFEMAYMDKPTIMYIPGEINGMSHYCFENHKLFSHIFFCKTEAEVFSKTDELLSVGRGTFNFSKSLFKHVDTDNTKRLVEWLFSALKNRESKRTQRNLTAKQKREISEKIVQKMTRHKLCMYG